MTNKRQQIKFNVFSFMSTFARSLIEIFISLYLFKNGLEIKQIISFYLIENLISIPLTYVFVKIGERFTYSHVMVISIVSFVILQVVLKDTVNTMQYILLIALLYSVYRRAYWVARKFILIQIMPKEKSSKLFSIVLIIGELATIAAGYFGSLILDNVNMVGILYLSSSLLLISIIPLASIKYNSKKTKIALIDSIKRFGVKNYVLFPLMELNDVIKFIFPLYITLYVKNTYAMVGIAEIVSNVAVVLFIFLYGKIINEKKNYLILSTLLVIITYVVKVQIVNYIIVVVCLIEGIVKKMQEQSINKVCFEDRGDLDPTNFNLVYQMFTCFVRAVVSLPLIFISDVRSMITVATTILFIITISYLFICKIEKEKNYDRNKEF